MEKAASGIEGKLVPVGEKLMLGPNFQRPPEVSIRRGPGLTSPPLHTALPAAPSPAGSLQAPRERGTLQGAREPGLTLLGPRSNRLSSKNYRIIRTSGEWVEPEFALQFWGVGHIQGPQDGTRG